MTRQPDLFRPMLARVTSTQGELFDTRGPLLPARDCAVCGAGLEPTPGGYVTCPRGCLKLLPATNHEGETDAEVHD